MKKIMIVLSSILILLGTACPHRAQADESMTGKFIFEFCQNTFPSGTVLHGFYIDNEGSVWKYDHSGEQWWPRGSEGLFYESDLQDKYRNPKKVGVVDKTVLSAMVSLIDPAFHGETKQERAGTDSGSMSYRAYLYDSASGDYKEVLLSVRGDVILQNTSDAAKTLVQWQTSLYSKEQPGFESERSRQDRQKQMTIRAVNPQIRVMQKVPSPRPEITVEQRGPFPIENGDNQNH
jgi:hypothetical protein